MPIDALNIIIKRIRKILRLNLSAIFAKILRRPATKKFIISMVQTQLFDEGVDGNDDTLGQYTPFTQQIKQDKGQRFDHITLFDTGDFYSSMKVTVDTSGITISGDGQKEDTNLFTEYGEAILSLTPDNLDLLRELLKREFFKEVQKRL